MTLERDDGLLQRIWKSWTGFWFTPADPTPLCLMRIFAGILTLYVHVAYTIDLVDFFGPDGWVSQAQANKTRLSLPHMKPRHLSFERSADDLLTMTDEARRREQVDRDIELPPDPKLRELVKEFILRTLNGSPNDADQALGFLNAIAIDGERGREVLRYLTTLSRDPSERTNTLKPFVDDKLTDEERLLLPPYFARLVTPEQRTSFIDQMTRFHDLLPKQPDDQRRIMQLLLDTSPEDWVALVNFVYKMRKMKPEDRGPYLDFYNEWNVSPDSTHAQGMPVVSPWFHVKDTRLLWTVHGLHLVAILMFTVGMYTRVTAVLTWQAGLAYINRAQPYLFGQDTMMNLCLFYLMLSPCGAKWSLDRWMARKRAEAAGRELPPVQPSVSAGFVIRVFQIQYCLMYMSAGLSKLKGNSWWNGTALYHCLANPEFAPMHVGLYRDFLKWMCTHQVIWELCNTGVVVFTLITEIGFPFLIWTRLRPLMVALALLMHLGIGMIMGLSVFSLFMFCHLLCWIPADAINWMFESEPS